MYNIYEKYMKIHVDAESCTWVCYEMKDEIFEHQLLLFQGHILIMLNEYQQSGNPWAEGILLF